MQVSRDKRSIYRGRFDFQLFYSVSTSELKKIVGYYLQIDICARVEAIWVWDNKITSAK